MGRFDRRGGRKGPRWNNGLTRRPPRPARITQYRPANDASAEGSANPLRDSEDLDGDTDMPQYDEDAASTLTKRFEDAEVRSLLDEQLGFVRYESGPQRTGWMINMQSTIVKDPEWTSGRSAVDFYFLEEDGGYFKATLKHSPYFYLKCKMGAESEVEDYLRRRIGNTIEAIQRVPKEDLDMPNHLSGPKRIYLRLVFRNTSDLVSVRKMLLPIAAKNGQSTSEHSDASALHDALNDHNEILHGIEGRPAPITGATDAQLPATQCIVDLREHDIPYHLRVCIDLHLRVGLWYTVQAGSGTCTMSRIPGRDVRPDPVVLAFDIETSKAPLKFPDAAVDPIMMISYMIDGQGHLITNREIVGDDIESFEYTPRPEYPGHFAVCNAKNERAMLARFFEHILLVRPTVFVTYNGDSFDWPFVEARAAAHGMSMRDIVGFGKASQDEYRSTYAIHMDCYRWVKRDSYLPAGSQGLKSVTTIKLGYDPLELDPEEMTLLASSDPQTLANYSVSDAVATYYVYMKYVHPFIFSLCNIIPLSPDEVLRRGSGTLCETLLMTEAFAANVIMPNKHAGMAESFHNGHLLYGETYIGGHVEALESGVFRSDIEYAFRLDPVGLKRLISDLDRALEFCLKCEGVTSTASVANYQTIRSDIQGRLEELLARPGRSDRPLIYHLDVAAMYPNIILTNRLQPSAMVDEAACAVCDFNRPGKQCQRRMRWSWRGEFYTARMSEYKQVRAQLEAERFPPEDDPRGPKVRPFHALSAPAQRALLERRLTKYSQKVHKRVRTTEVMKREAIVCQRENSFYIDTVRLFRDRRYEYKDRLKVAKRMLEEASQAKNATRIEEAGKLSILYDSLQLAHKCILNSFYGYVMRKGARWYSMEMGGIVCETGGAIIRLARELVEQIGRPLELDTDGIWCMLPWTFPQNYTFEVRLEDGKTKRIPFAYPCGMLNHLVHDSFTNSQYHTLVDPAKLRYSVTAENSIFFEIDGPYRAMILPSSVEEGRLLKKRYAVFANDGRLAELKGFEVKRRGELKIVKVFQTQLFRTFLEGATLAGCYAEVARVANYWLDILYSSGASMSDAELFEMISENRSMSRSLEDYGGQKSTSISTAKRLAEFLGDEMTKDKGLACRFVISAKPIGDPVASRAVPVAIFSAEPSVRRHYLRKWLRDNTANDQTDPRSIIDWRYYIERLESMIQKLIVIPAAMQGVANPVPRVTPPPWLHRKASAAKGSLRQTSIADAFKKKARIDADPSVAPRAIVEDDAADNGKENEPELADMEDSFTARLSLLAAGRAKSKRTALPREGVSIDADYSIWIQQQRARWQALRSRLAAQDNGNEGGDRGRRAELRLPWQIVHYEVLSLGVFTVWAVLDGRMHRLALTVPRKIYVHSFKDITHDDELLRSILRPVTLEWRLPRPYSIRGQPPSNAAHHLFELTTSEARFAEHQHMLSAAFSHAHIEQVYEADVPLSFHLAHSLGCITGVDPEKLSAISARSAGQQPRFELDDLVGFKSIAYQSYLDESDQRMAILYVGHVHTSDSRHLVALCLSTQKQAFPLRFIIVDPAGRAGVTVPNIKKLLSALQEASELVVKTGSGFFGDCFGDIESPAIVDRLDDVDDVILEYLHRCSRKTRHRHLTIGLVNAADGGSFRPNLPTIPLARFAPSSALNPTSSEWLRNAMKEQLISIGSLGGLVPELLALSRYGHLPLGMLVEACRLTDTRRSAALTLIADVFLARSLRARGYLFPASTPSSLLPAEGFASSAVPMERAGAFTHVCLEMELSGLAINAMLEYSRILRPKSAAAAKEASTGTIEEALKQTSIGCNDAVFDGCRALVRSWARDYSGDGAARQDAQQMLGHFYQWIRTSTPYAGRFFRGSSCYELLSMAMARCLHVVADHVHRLGSLVIYADTHRLVLRTAKEDRWAAQAYWNYLKRQLQSIPELQWIEFTPVATWRCLIWLDAANYAGCLLPDSDAADKASESLLSAPSTADEGRLVMRWAIADYLPSMIQGAFKSMLGQYVATFHAQLGSTSLADEPAMPAFIPHSSDLHSDGPDEGSASRAFLSFAFCQKFLAVVKDIQRVWGHPPPTDRQERIRWDEARRFSLLPGSHLAGLCSGPLEFVKSATAVFSLHAPSRPFVYSLRRQAFALLGQSEFADSAQFRHPCRSIRLPDVVCPSCLAVRDLDFGRDADLQPKPSDIAARSIFCQLCSLPMDMACIESELLEKVVGLMGAHQVQDLQCSKCRRMPETNMHARCRCTGSYTTAYSGEEAMSIVNGYKRISTAFGMRVLEDECVFIATLQEQC